MVSSAKKSKYDMSTLTFDIPQQELNDCVEACVIECEPAVGFTDCCECCPEVPQPLMAQNIALYLKKTGTIGIRRTSQKIKKRKIML